MDEDDEILLAAVQDSSERAWNTLIDRHQQAVRTFLRGLTANPADADDIAQETFLAAWKQAKSFRGQGKVRSWLFSIAWRKAKGSQRGWFRAARRDTAYHGSLEIDEVPKTPAEDRIAVRQALLSLPLDQRAAVMLCLGDGYTHAEAAEALAIPLGTIKSYVLRGREKLRGILGSSVMSEDLDVRIAEFLKADAPPLRDPVFRMRVLERREQRQFQRRIYTMAVGILAILLISMFAISIEDGAPGTMGILAIGTALASTYIAFRGNLRQILRRFTL